MFSRGLIYAVLVFLIGIVLLFGVLIGEVAENRESISALPKATPTPLLMIDEPATVNNRIPGVEGPALHQGEQFRSEFRQCNTSGEQLTVRIAGTFRQYFDSSRQDLPLFQGITDTIEIGCALATINLNLPASTLSIGTWDLLLTYEVIQNGQVTAKDNIMSVKFQVVAP